MHAYLKALTASLVLMPYGALLPGRAHNPAAAPPVVLVAQAAKEEIAPRKYPWAAENGVVYNTAPTLNLIALTAQGPAGQIWVRSADDGLHVWGKVHVREQGFHWPRQQSEMLSSDHVEIWLATAPNIDLPSIGFGAAGRLASMQSAENCKQAYTFGSAATDTGQANPQADAVEHCERWFSEQAEYRAQLKHLFVRQWLVAGAGGYPFGGPEEPHVSEAFASTAWNWMKANVFPEARPNALKPQSAGMVRAVMEVEREPNPKGLGRMTGYRFHVFIPFAEFPPSQQVSLSDLYLRVDVFGAASEGAKMGAYSTTSPSRQWGDPETFNHLHLQSPPVYRISPCDDNPVQTDDQGNQEQAWFFPSEERDLHSAFLLANPPTARQVMDVVAGRSEGLGPYGLSPEVEPRSFFWQPAAGHATVCGPGLTWRRGDRVERTSFPADGKYFATKVLADGWTLVRSGPFITEDRYRSLPCNWMNFVLYAISPEGQIFHALELKDGMCNRDGLPDGTDLTLAPDWKRVELFEEFQDENSGAESWEATAYCLNGHSYEQCGKHSAASGPEPPHFPALRNE